jgi:alpha-tubulin suppressor-like RCC1 family protein
MLSKFLSLSLLLSLRILSFGRNCSSLYGRHACVVIVGLFVLIVLPARAAVSAVAAGDSQSLFVKTDGTLWAMGNNDYGKLGDGTTTHRASPVQVTSGVSAVATGTFHSLFVKTDGTLWAMGFNQYGQLGDGTKTQRVSPVQVASGVRSVAAGQQDSLFVKIDGTLWAMGLNQYGELGDGTTTPRTSPVPIASGVRSVSSGYNHSLFLKTDGSLWAMGYNQYGELGDGTTILRSTPVLVASGVTAMAAGFQSSRFVKNDGTLWAMGFNQDGNLGDGTTTQRISPVQIASGVSAVAAESLFVKVDGTLWAVGPNPYGNLGDGTMTQRISPVQITSGVSAVAAGGGHSLFVKVDGTFWAMGNNQYGQLGDGTSTTRTSPIRLLLPRIATQPSPQTVIQGDDASFTVVAIDTGSLTYQWQKDGAAITGATAASYTLTSVTMADAGGYTVVVTNSEGSTTSTTATLTVNASPSITSQPNAQTVTAGSSVSFSVVASGTSPLTYQWRKDGFAISGATSATYSFGPATTEGAGKYSVVITNAFGTVTSADATLVVTTTTAPIIAVSPRSFSDAAGSNILFSVTATGLPPLSYQWFFNGQPLVGQTSERLLLADVQTAQAGSYTVKVTNSLGSATSIAAVLQLAASSAPTAIVDATFTPTLLLNGSVVAAVEQADGKLIIGGSNFFLTGGVSPFALARLNLDGSLDSTFNIGTGLSSGGSVTNLVLQPDGRVSLARFKALTVSPEPTSPD